MALKTRKPHGAIFLQAQGIKIQQIVFSGVLNTFDNAAQLKFTTLYIYKNLFVASKLVLINLAKYHWVILFPMHWVVKLGKSWHALASICKFRPMEKKSWPSSCFTSASKNTVRFRVSSYLETFVKTISQPFVSYCQLRYVKKPAPVWRPSKLIT